MQFVDLNGLARRNLGEAEIEVLNIARDIGFAGLKGVTQKGH